MLSNRNNQSNQVEASVEPIESAGVELVAPIPIPEYVNELVTRAKSAAGRLATLSTAVKNRALLAMAEALSRRMRCAPRMNWIWMPSGLRRRSRRWRTGCV